MKKLNLKKSTWKLSRKEQIQSLKTHLLKAKKQFPSSSTSKNNDLVRNLDLSKQAAEFLASRLNEKHVLHGSAKMSFYRKRDELFLPYFIEER